MKKGLKEIIRVMGETHGCDISPYDETFLVKSIDRRRESAGIKTLTAYAKYLSENSTEAETLSDSLNITYSEFFRNPLTFALLEQFILPDIVEKKAQDNRGEIRILLAGCAAGQEPYSVAILLDEMAVLLDRPVPFRIFAIDLSETDLAFARKGVYSATAVGNVRLRHLDSYFSRRGKSFIIAPRIRERVNFSLYDLMDKSTTSPPVSIYGGFDLVMCCNVLLYYRPEAQQFIMDKVRRSMAFDGYLITGGTERQIVESVGWFRSLTPPAAVFQKMRTGR